MFKLIRWFLLPFILHCVAEQVRYVSLERPAVLYFDARYIKNYKITSLRVGRSNPVHYVNAAGDLLIGAGNNVTVDVYWYEFLSNTYKRSFVEFSNRLCDFYEKSITGAAIKKRMIPKRPCPLSPNHYEWRNISIPPWSLPKTFPFQKGRFFFNMTWTTSKIPMLCLSLDFELKSLRKNLTKSDWFT